MLEGDENIIVTLTQNESNANYGNYDLKRPNNLLHLLTSFSCGSSCPLQLHSTRCLRRPRSWSAHSPGQWHHGQLLGGRDGRPLPSGHMVLQRHTAGAKQ